jgi:hypothetical protein
LWAGACMHAWEVSKACLRGLRRRSAIDCHCMVAAVTDGGEGKTKGGRANCMGRWPSTQAEMQARAAEQRSGTATCGKTRRATGRDAKRGCGADAVLRVREFERRG